MVIILTQHALQQIPVSADDLQVRQAAKQWCGSATAPYVPHRLISSVGLVSHGSACGALYP